MEIRIRSNIKDIIKQLEQFDRFSSESINITLNDAISILQKAVLRYTPVGAGPIHLKDRIEGRVIHKGRFVVVAHLAPTLQYGEAVEYGTRPHQAPIDPLIEWVEAKLHYYGEEAESIAWSVWTKISRRGTEGHHMFERGFRDAIPHIRRLLDRIPHEIIKRLEKK